MMNNTRSLIHEFIGYGSDEKTCTGNSKTCPNDECLVCGERECPHGEPLHFHHDGCPACVFDEEKPTGL
jgi:hypothetical protein